MKKKHYPNNSVKYLGVKIDSKFIISSHFFPDDSLNSNTMML